MALSTSHCPMEPPIIRTVGMSGMPARARASALSIALLNLGWIGMPMGRMMRSGMPACTM